METRAPGRGTPILLVLLVMLVMPNHGRPEIPCSAHSPAPPFPPREAGTGGRGRSKSDGSRRDHFFSSASIAFTKAWSSGFTCVAKRPLIAPSLPMMNFSKFHFTSPFGLAWVVSVL